MPSKKYEIPGFKNPVVLVHEDDWSGMARIEWWDHTYHHVEIPAGIILAISFAETKEFVIGAIEATLEQFIKDPKSRGQKT